MHREEEGGNANSLGHLAWPGKVLRGTRHGRRPWSSPELREQHGGVPRFAKKVDGEAAGEEGSSPARRTEAEKAGRRATVAVVFLTVQALGCGCECGNEEGERGAGSATTLSHERPRDVGVGAASWERGAGSSFLCVRIGGNGWGRRIELTSGPRMSKEGEGMLAAGWLGLQA